ncbi:high-affinity branched-chain amino acid ABC transporter permease LivM [Rhodopila globiformis]|uniref:Branched-chain amino acid ABC transporter permease n=1 Tax=Rhodopila globiformis TaxID=1071 RepID=A0A2S6N128_RHOGL|nr:high-affinity branched-chain amino acid ABC transporter permease LivM [Rhodopila globiformis]PPQ28300.1 branched-chain amino acid ABC transporter permease [Rhodopila globiformis]
MTPLRDAFLSAAVALGLFGPMVGLLTVSGEHGLSLELRPIATAVIVGLVFLGRLLVLSWRGRGRVETYKTNRALAEGIAHAGKFIAPVLLVAAVALPFTGSRYYVDLGTLVLTYIMLGWGLNIVVGLAGLLDLGYVAFYAVGAYSYALLSTTYDLGFWTCLPLAGLFAGCAGVMLGFPVLRLRGDYLAIVTLAFGEIIRIVLTNWVSLTNGPNGITGIPRPTLFGLRFSMEGGEGTFAGFFGIEPATIQRVIFLYYVILVLALLTNWVSLRLRRIPLGRAWEALREDEIACRSLGINVRNTKLTAFGMGAMFGGLAGAFFATRQAFISPESFTFIESATVLAIVVLGGMGSQLGVALAAIVMVGGLETLRDVLSFLGDQMNSPLFAGIAGQLPLYRMLIFGLVLVVMMVLRPRGLISGRTPTVALGARKEIAAELVAQGRG